MTFQKNQLQDKENKLSEIIELNNKILSEYDNDKLSFSEALNNIAIGASRIDNELFEFIFDDTLKDDTKTCGLSNYRKQSLLRQLTPTFLEIIEIVSQISCYRDINVHEIYGKIYEDIQQKKETVTYEKVRDIVTSADFQSKYLKEYTNKYPDISSYIGKSILIYVTIISDKDINNLIKELTRYIPDLPNIPHIPQHLERSLHNLAKQSQFKAQELEVQLSQFQLEVENWYDNSMLRAKGVYKRNARLVAIIIGFVIAIAANADTFHIVDRLSKDQVLRESVSSYAEEVRDKAKSDFEKTGKVSSTIKQDIDKKIKEEISLPLGWNKQNSTEERFSRHHVFSLFDEDDGKKDGKKIETKYLFLFPKSILTVCGWLVSAIAISMGSSFWFDLLGKFIDIKNVGKKTPESSDANSSKIQ